LDGLLLVLAALISEITFGSPFDSLVEGLLSDKSVLAAMMKAMKVPSLALLEISPITILVQLELIRCGKLNIVDFI
jgi:hypothetical protein